MMSPATVYSYIKQDRETQDLTPKKPGPKRPGKLEAYRDFIIRMVEDHPDWTVRQYREYLLTEQNVYVSVGGMCEFLNKIGLTLKKKLTEPKKWQHKKVKNSELITGKGCEIYQSQK
jgi:transposase